MVWAFCTGLVIGFPVGCYLREKGYATRLRNAYVAVAPEQSKYTTDNLQKLLPDQRRNQFYRDLKTGDAKPQDFERYIYGGQYSRKFGSDDRDAAEDKSNDIVREWDQQAREHIAKI